MAKGVQTPHFCANLRRPKNPKFQKIVSFGSNVNDFANSCGLNCKRVGFRPLVGDFKDRCSLKIAASAATTTEKPSIVPEIVLQPIKEISGTVKLPGSKSLSNRILLLAALSEVISCFAIMMLYIRMVYVWDYSLCTTFVEKVRFLFFCNGM